MQAKYGEMVIDLSPCKKASSFPALFAGTHSASQSILFPTL
jgi:hypothetical protein